MTKPEKDLRILVIEDNPGDFELVEDFILEKIDLATVTHARSFKEAKEKFLLVDFPFDVVLLDLSLPDKFGEALIKEITDLCVDKPIIVLTGYSDVDFGVKSLSLGITDYLLKDELTALSLYKSIIYSIERKKNIADLEQSEREYSELFHLSPQPMWVFDVMTLNFLDVNEAAISHYGYTRENFLDMTVRDIRPENEMENLENALAYFTARQPKNFEGVFSHRKKDGSIIQVEIRCNGINYRGKQANLILINDVTERLKYIKEIKEQNEKLREIAWMQSHIVRAPIARIQGLIPLIIDDNNNNNGEKKTMLEYMLISVNELDGIVKNITDKTQ